MGKRSATETVFGIVGAFLEKNTWTQAALAKRLEMTPASVRKRLEEMRAGGMPLERDEEHPHVHWSIRKGWLPGALQFKSEEVPDLLRVIARAPRDRRRARLLEAIKQRMPGINFDGAAVTGPELSAENEALAVLEDGANQKIPVHMRYHTANTGALTWRHVSVHQVEAGAHPRFIATCHRDGKLKRFRVEGVTSARLDQNEPYRVTTPEALEKYRSESVDGFHQSGDAVHCAFVVRAPEDAWAGLNLPEGSFKPQKIAGGTRFTIDTAALIIVARFVVGLGDAARVETPELAREVAQIAKGALKSASSSERPHSLA